MYILTYVDVQSRPYLVIRIVNGGSVNTVGTT